MTTATMALTMTRSDPVRYVAGLKAAGLTNAKVRHRAMAKT